MMNVRRVMNRPAHPGHHADAPGVSALLADAEYRLYVDLTKAVFVPPDDARHPEPSIDAGERPEGDLPKRWDEALAALDQATTAHLRWIAGWRFAGPAAERLEELNARAQRTGLSESELAEQDALSDFYEWHVLYRSKARALLRERGDEPGKVSSGV